MINTENTGYLLGISTDILFVIKFDTQINLGNEYATNCETWSLSFVKLCRIMLRNSILEKYF